MIFCETQIKYKDKETDDPGLKHLTFPENANNPGMMWVNHIKELNGRLGLCFDPDNKISAYICDAKEGCFDAVIAYPAKNINIEYCYDSIRKVIEENYSVKDMTFSESQELSATKFQFLLEKADDNGYVRRWHMDQSAIGIDFFKNNQFSVEEKLSENRYESLEDATKAAELIMADKSFREELDRIYSDDNVKGFYGNPVHYKISASSTKAAMDIVNILVPALIENKRLYGKRIVRVFNINEGCYDESELENLFRSSQGNAVIIEMCGTDEDHGNFASSYHRVIEFFYKVITKYQLNTLCIFVECSKRPGFSAQMVSKLQEDIRIVIINEGYGDREQAKQYLLRLADPEIYTPTDEEMEEELSKKSMYSVEDVYLIHDSWYKNGLSKHIYKAYSNFECVLEEKKDNCKPYEELQQMIGLANIKKLVDEIIDAGKIGKLKQGCGLSYQRASMHMVFTGNPGSAKTSVARLLAQILRKENIIDGGKFVECGRADLIARYVGWTAKQVRAKFREAKGGILFIDEAYSLVDDTRSFADEAINTIVQEMENQRDDVIVILAGYPGKMSEFLDKNEGLRSRIAFHLDFPDYNPDEMTDILKFMIDKQGYHIGGKALEKCHGIFESACLMEDFGNGRFARNLFEQAQMAQSRRLVTEYKDKKIGSKALRTLKCEDFEVNIAEKVKTQRSPIGFVV